MKESQTYSKEKRKWGPLPTNPFEALGINSNSPKEEIYRAWKKASRKYHPDRNPKNKEEATEWIQIINEAKDLLTKPNFKGTHFKGWNKWSAGTYTHKEKEAAQEKPEPEPTPQEKEAAEQEKQRVEQERVQQENLKREREAAEQERLRQAEAQRQQEAAAEAQRQQEETERLQRVAAEEQIRQDTEKLSKEEREKMAWGIHNIGFKVEKWKSDFFAEQFDKQSKRSDSQGTMSRFFAALRDRNKLNAEMAKKKILAGKDAPALTKMSSVAYLTKNIVRPVRIIMDITGMSPLGAQRLAMMGGMAASSVTGAMKEARFANQELVEQTRVGRRIKWEGLDPNDPKAGTQETLTDQDREDITRAEEEAWKIYKNAQRKAGTSGVVSPQQLKDAYLHEIPKDLQDRLEKSTTGVHLMTQKLLKKHLKFDTDRLNKNIQDIENDNTLKPEKKEAKKDQLLRRWERRLTDYDRVLTQTGTVDEYAMSAHYVESGAKNFVRLATVTSVYQGLNNLWERISHIGTGDLAEHVTSTNRPLTNNIANAFKGSEAHPESAVAGTPIPTTNQTPEISTANTEQSSFSLRVGADQPKFGQAKLDEHFFTEKIKPAFKLNLDSQTPVQVKMPEALHAVSVEQDAVVGQGEGVEHTLIRQIKHNFELAKKLGYDGKPDNTKALEKFAGVEAHKIAIARGYVDKFTGEEIHVKKAGEVAYKLIPGDGKDNYKVEEFHKEGDKFIFQEVHEKMADGTETKFEGKDANDYESVAPKYVAPTHEHAVPEHTAAQTTKTNEGSLINPDQEKYYRDRGYTGPMKIEDINAWEHAQKIKALESDIHDKFETPTPEKPVETTKAPELLKDFQKNPFSLRTAKLFDAQNTYLRNFAKLFPENTEDYIKSMHKLDFKELTTRTSSENNFVQYLNKIQEVTKLKPKIGFFHMFNKEKVGEYIVRALQYAAKKGDMLEKLKIQN